MFVSVVNSTNGSGWEWEWLMWCFLASKHAYMDFSHQSNNSKGCLLHLRKTEGTHYCEQKSRDFKMPHQRKTILCHLYLNTCASWLPCLRKGGYEEWPDTCSQNIWFRMEENSKITENCFLIMTSHDGLILFCSRCIYQSCSFYGHYKTKTLSAYVLE